MEQENVFDTFTGIEHDEAFGNLSDQLPFDPASLSLSSKQVTMDALVRRFKQNTLILNPDFQRAEVWTPAAKSRLIESLLLRIPIPMFYFSSDVKNVYTVIDGLQRLSAIRDFVVGVPVRRAPRNEEKEEKPEFGPMMKLEGLEYLKNFEGMTLDDLPMEFFNRVMETEFLVTVIEPNTPEEVKRNVFKRINTGGLPLSQQEVRNALYAGPATALLKELASDSYFKVATNYSLRALRADDQEIILRLLSFLIRTPEEYSSEGMDNWLAVAMQIMNFRSQESRELKEKIEMGLLNPEIINQYNEDKIRKKFRLAMERGHALFGLHAFRKSFRGKKNPIAKPLFEMWGVILSGLSDSEFAGLLENKEEFLREYEALIHDDEYALQIGKNSNLASVVPKRFERLRELTRKYIA